MSTRPYKLPPAEHAAKLRKLEEIGRRCYRKGCHVPASIKIKAYKLDAHGNRATPDQEILTCGKGHHRLPILDAPSTWVVLDSESLPLLGKFGTEREHGQLSQRRSAARTMTFQAPE